MKALGRRISFVTHFKIYATASAFLLGMLFAPISARAECGANLADAIGAFNIARQATAMVGAAGREMAFAKASGNAAAIAAATTTKAAADATLATAKANFAIRKASSDTCISDTRKALQKSGNEIRDVKDGGGFVSMAYCEPVQVTLGKTLEGGGALLVYGFNFGAMTPIGAGEPPIFVNDRSCLGNGAIAGTATIPSPPPDTGGTCPAGKLWSGSSLVGCIPCPSHVSVMGCPPPPLPIHPVHDRKGTPEPPSAPKVHEPKVAAVPPEQDSSPKTHEPKAEPSDETPSEPRQRTRQRQGGGGGGGAATGIATALGLIGALGGHKHGGGGRPTPRPQPRGGTARGRHR
jgi:hypothetical protein